MAGSLGGRDFSPDEQLGSIGVLTPEASGAEAPRLKTTQMAELKLGPPKFEKFSN